MGDPVSWDDFLNEEQHWLFRGVFLRSPEDDWMRDLDEIVPPRLDRVGSEWREQHRNGNTETAYTSWSTDWDIARMFAEEARDDAQDAGEVVVYRVRVDSLTNRGYRGRDDESEILTEGTVEGVERSTGHEEEEDNE
jgi:hypothetical protein